jgi:hypothetical protein
VRMGCDVPAPAVGRAWLLLCPSREGARGGVSVKGVRLCSVLPRLPPAPPCRGRGRVAWHARRSDACCRLQAAKCACVAVPSAGVQHVEQARDFVFVEVAPCPMPLWPVAVPSAGVQHVEQARDFVFVEVAPCPCGQSLAYPAPLVCCLWPLYGPLSLSCCGHPPPAVLLLPPSPFVSLAVMSTNLATSP